MSECRYILRKGSVVEIVDTLHTPTVWIGADEVRAIRLTRSNLEELKKELDRVLCKPQGKCNG